MNRLKQYREAHELSKSQLATDTGVSRSHLIYVERGESEISVQKAALLAQRLGVSIDVLFNPDAQLPAAQAERNAQLLHYLETCPAAHILEQLTQEQRTLLYYWLDMNEAEHGKGIR